MEFYFGIPDWLITLWSYPPIQNVIIGVGGLVVFFGIVYFVKSWANLMKSLDNKRDKL